MTVGKIRGRGSKLVSLIEWMRGQPLVRGIYRLLPSRWRRGVNLLLARRAARALMFPRTSAWARDPGVIRVERVEPNVSLPGVNMFGYMRGEFGLGESARAYARAVIAEGIPVAVNDVDLDLPHSCNDDSLGIHLSKEAPYPVSIVFVNPDYLDDALSKIGERLPEGGRLIACWFWELETLPPSWLPSIHLVDEFIVSSRFIESALRKVTDKPITFVPQPLMPAMGSGLERQDFRLPENSFIFLCSFDFNSWIERKNPFAVIEAFKQAFPLDEKDVCLLIKTSNGFRNPDGLARLLRAVEDDSRIVVRDDVISRYQLHDLQKCCDAYVSLHRAEGFGLGLAECMALGKPVIGTGWSGNLDFMDQQNSCLVDYTLVRVEDGQYDGAEGAMWAAPDVTQAAAAMRGLVNDPGRAEEMGRSAASTIKTLLSPDLAAKRILARLVALRNAQSCNEPGIHEISGDMRKEES